MTPVSGPQARIDPVRISNFDTLGKLRRQVVRRLMREEAEEKRRPAVKPHRDARL